MHTSTHELINDAVAEALARKVTEQVTANLSTQWSTILEELASTRKSNLELTRRVEVLQELVESQTQNTTHILQRAHQELTQTRENNQKAAQIIAETLKTLGIEE